MTEAEKILKRFKAAVSRKTNWIETYRDAQKFIAPHRETFDEELKGARKDGSDEHIFDSTAIAALYRFQSNLHSSLTPPMRKFVSLVPGSDVEAEDVSKLAAPLAAITDVLFSKINNSNFDTQIAESYLDLGFGTAALLVFQGDIDNPFNFVNVPLSQLYLEEGANGAITTSFRKFKLPARVVKEQWPDAVISKDLEATMATQEGKNKDIDFIEATLPGRVMVKNKKTKREEEVDGFRYIVIEKKSKSIIVDRHMRSSPWVIFRWANLPGEIYGRGPCLSALPDVKSLNKTKELLLKAASIATFGMYTMADDGVVNFENIKFGPGAIIPVSANPGSLQGPTLSPLETPGNPNLSQLVIEDLKASINEIMFGDPLGDVNNPVKTATEISLRQQDLAKRIGSAYGKLQYELIAPLINRCLDILDDLDLIDLGQFRVDGGKISIQHVSPLAQAQNEEDIVNMTRYAETVLGLFGPEMGMALMHPDKFAIEYASKLNIDPSIPITQEEADQIKAAMAQQAQQAQQAGQGNVEQ